MLVTYVVDVWNAGCFAHRSAPRRQQLFDCHFLHTHTQTDTSHNASTWRTYREMGNQKTYCFVMTTTPWPPLHTHRQTHRQVTNHHSVSTAGRVHSASARTHGRTTRKHSASSPITRIDRCICVCAFRLIEALFRRSGKKLSFDCLISRKHLCQQL